MSATLTMIKNPLFARRTGNVHDRKILSILKRAEGPMCRSAVLRESGMATGTFGSSWDQCIKKGYIQEILLPPHRNEQGGLVTPVVFVLSQKGKFHVG